MKTPESKLQQLAAEIASDLQAQQLALEPERLSLEARLLEIKLIGDSASLAHQRSLHFQPSLKGDYLCPSCWVKSGRQSRLIPDNSEEMHQDISICEHCGFEFVFDIN